MKTKCFSTRVLAPAAMACFVLASFVHALPGYKTLHIGNSLTDETYGFNDAAMSLGHTNVQYGRMMQPGAPIHWIWTHPSDGFKEAIHPLDGSDATSYTNVKDYLKSTALDVVILQIFPANGDAYWDRWVVPVRHFSPTIDGLVGLAGCAYQGNPDCQVYIYASHTMKRGTIDSSLKERYIDYKALADTVRNAYPGRKPLLIIPAPLAFNAMMDEGFGDLWVGDGHANDNGKYLLSVLFYSFVYKRDCAGAHNVYTNVYDRKAWLPKVSADFAAKAQQVAWNIAQTSEYSNLSVRIKQPQWSVVPYTNTQSAAKLSVCFPKSKSGGVWIEQGLGGSFNLCGRQLRGMKRELRPVSGTQTKAQ